jgi:hypothetical protein
LRYEKRGVTKVKVDVGILRLNKHFEHEKILIGFEVI